MIKLYLIHGYIAELQQIISGTFPVYLPGRGDPRKSLRVTGRELKLTISKQRG